jgi:acyl-CoA synthetase (AMP-forming)/AMP-acid ligase II/thioesterase domain-containing protein/acyl carrier protein
MSDDANLSCRSIHQLLRRQSGRDGSAPAIEAPGRRALSYADLLRQVEATAAALVGLGVKSGDRVAIVLPNGPEMAVTFLAVASIAGCAPLNPAYRDHEFEIYLSDLRPALLLVGPEDTTPARTIAAKFGIPVAEVKPLLDEAAGTFTIATESSPPPTSTSVAFAEGEDIALLLHTSGTTSRPKLVPLTHLNLCTSARNISGFLALTPADRCLNVMPLYHIHGLIGAVLSSISAGACVVCSPYPNALQFFDWIDAHRPTWYTAVPSIHASILERAPQRQEVIARSRLRFIRSCSAAMPPSLMARLEEAFHAPLLEAYGMTEASHQISSNPLPPAKRKPGSVGIPTGTKVVVLDPHGNELPAGETGEIAVCGDNVMRGYLGDPAANESAFSGQRLCTGDLGRIDPDGYLFIDGRTKEIINRGGEKISPREIEEALLDHPAIADAVAFAVPDTWLGEDVGAAVVLRPTATAEENELRAFLGKSLAHFKIPRRILTLPELPKGATGKMQRSGLAAKLGLADISASTAERRAAYATPRSELERLLAAMWQQILGQRDIGIHADFFDIGGDSLLALQLVVSIEKVTGIRLSVAALFETPTIESLAAFLTAHKSGDNTPRIAPIQPKGSRPPFFCVDAGPSFRNLALQLGADQPFLGLFLPEQVDLPQPYRLEDIARFHAESIRAVQPEGPYFLGGLCNAGIVAYEIAQQLCAQGQRVALLVLFDAVNPAQLQKYPRSAVGFIRVFNTLQKLWFHLKAMRDLPLAEVPRYCLERMGTIVRTTGFWARAAIYQIGLKLKLAQPKVSKQTEMIHRIALRNYRPKPYDGAAVVLRRSLRATGRFQDDQLGWSGFARGGLVVHELPGRHHDMLLEPEVRNTARLLRAALVEEQAAHPSATSDRLSTWPTSNPARESGSRPSLAFVREAGRPDS